MSYSLRPHGLSVHGLLQTRILEWVAVPFSRGSSQSRDQTQVSSITGDFCTNWTTRETQIWTTIYIKERNNKDLLYSTENYTQYSIITLKKEYEYACVYIYMNHFAMYQKHNTVNKKVTVMPSVHSPDK